MISTSQFNYIHQPKTGGTFVTDAIFEAYGVTWTWKESLKSFLKGPIFKWAVKFDTPYGYLHVHGEKHPTLKAIPKKYQHLKVLTNIRNPLDIYVSHYEFGWWKRKEFLKYYKRVENFEHRFPNYPDLNFEDFLILQYKSFLNPEQSEFTDKDSPGLASRQFFKTYTVDPVETEKTLCTGAETLKNFKTRILSDIYFLKTHHLNRDLYDYLLSQGLPENRLTFILEKERVLPLGKGRSREQKWQKYYTKELKELVLQKDHILFFLFPEFLIQS